MPAATTATLTDSLEDYLETIYLLVRDGSVARVRDIARARDVKAGSVTPALKRLADAGLIDYAQREYIRLTPAGEREARRVLARHTILTRFFEEVLQLPPDAAEEQACAMEHNLSNDAMDRLVRFFEFMHVCPMSPTGFLEGFHRCLDQHAHVAAQEEPVPALPCALASAEGLPCALRPREDASTCHSAYDLAPGERARVTHVNAHGPIRQRLLDMGVLPDVMLEMERVAPAGDPVWVKLEGCQLALRRKEAESVVVRG